MTWFFFCALVNRMTQTTVVPERAATTDGKEFCCIDADIHWWCSKSSSKLWCRRVIMARPQTQQSQHALTNYTIQRTRCILSWLIFWRSPKAKSSESFEHITKTTQVNKCNDDRSVLKNTASMRYPAGINPWKEPTAGEELHAVIPDCVNSKSMFSITSEKCSTFAC